MPNINFEKMSLEDNINIVKWSYHSGGYIQKNTINLFPQLSNLNEKLSKAHLI